MPKQCLGRERGWLANLTWPLTHYVVTNMSVLLGLFFFRVLNRTTVIGRENIPHKWNTLLLSNHQSMIDSFLVGAYAFFPKSLLRPSLIPWNPAAEENFYRNALLAWFSDNWKCIPIKKGRKDVGAIYRMSEALRNGTMTLFPEGTRSRDGTIGRPRGGAGLLIHETKPVVIPVCIDGMDRLLPIGSIWPRFFKRVYIYYGEPVDLSDFYSQPKCKEVSQAIMNRVMDRIRMMRSEIQEWKAEKKVVGVYPGKKYNSQKA